MKIKKLVATVALAGAITAGTAGAAFAADGSTSTSGSTDPSAQPAKRHPGIRRAVRRGAFKIVLDTVGGTKEALRAALKGGQSISDYATSQGKKPEDVVTALVNAADTKLDQLATDHKLSQERVDAIKVKVPERVNTFVNRHFGQKAQAST